MSNAPSFISPIDEDEDPGVLEAPELGSDADRHATEVARFERGEDRAEVQELPDEDAEDEVAEPPQAQPNAEIASVSAAVERLASLMAEERAQRAAPRNDQPAPVKSLVDQFDTDDTFYDRAMRAKGFVPNAAGEYTREAAMAVRAALENAEIKREMAAQAARYEQQINEARLQPTYARAAEILETALDDYEAPSERVQHLIGSSVGDAMRKGLSPAKAVKEVLADLAPLLKPKAAPAPVVPARQPAAPRQPAKKTPNASIQRADLAMAVQARGKPAKTNLSAYERLEAARAKVTGN